MSSDWTPHDSFIFVVQVALAGGNSARAWQMMQHAAARFEVETAESEGKRAAALRNYMELIQRGTTA